MKKIGVKLISLITITALLIGALSSCAMIESFTHTHEHKDKHDDATHWKECSCGDKIDEGIHIGGEATCINQATCSVCGAAWGPLGEHNYTRVDKTSSEHWYSCSCGAIGERGSHKFVDGVCKCGYIDPVTPHTHRYRLIKYDTTSHWYECVCGDKDTSEAHYGGEATCLAAAICEGCKIRYGEPAPHTPTTVRKTDTHHTYICSCGRTISTEEHSFDENRACSCGFTLPPEEHKHSFTIENHDSTSHWNECECGASEDAVAHFGGSADCDSLAVCEGCGESYGDFGHAWNSGELIAKPDGDTEGMISYTCTKCGEGEARTVGSDKVIVTRAELEEAIVAAAWAFYMKKEQLQYDSQQITAVSATYAGTVRHTQEVSPEYGTSDNNIYLVCSAYIYECYLEAIGRRIFEAQYHPNGVLTTMLWICADNQMPEGFNDLPASTPQPRDENDRDMAIAKWIDTETYDDFLAESSFANRIETYDVDGSSAFYDWYEDGKIELVRTESGSYQYYLDGVAVSSADIKTKLIKWITKKVDGQYVNLRPGDVIIQEGHTLIHIGNGKILDCGGSKYNTSVGVDKVEANGAVYSRFNTINGTISKPGSFWAVIRPLDYYSYDVDGNLGNDIMMLDGEAITVKESTESRIEYPAMDIDRTVDITPYGTAAKGETLTYTIKITNNTNETNYIKWKLTSGYNGETYENLAVSELIPAGTVFLSASEGYTFDGDRISWCVDIPAGESVTLSYTVTVTAEIGEVITSDGGYVASIPSNSISNRVGGAKLTGEQIAKLHEIANSGTTALKEYGTDLAFAEAIFAELGIDLGLTTVSELVENLFSAEYFERMESVSCFYTHKTSAITMFTPDGEISKEYAHIAAMLVDGYYGGYRVFDHDEAKITELGAEGFDYTKMNGTIIDFRLDYLEVGDILVYAQSSDRGNTTLSHEMKEVWVMIYAGDGIMIEMSLSGTAKVYTGTATTARLVEAYKNTYDLFFLLRPTQAV